MIIIIVVVVLVVVAALIIVIVIVIKRKSQRGEFESKAKLSERTSTRLLGHIQLDVHIGVLYATDINIV